MKTDIVAIAMRVSIRVDSSQAATASKSSMLPLLPRGKLTTSNMTTAAASRATFSRLKKGSKIWLTHFNHPAARSSILFASGDGSFPGSGPTNFLNRTVCLEMFTNLSQQMARACAKPLIV